MNITQVKIFPVEEEKLKAFVSIVFDHCFMVNDIKVIQGKDGLFLSMPSRRKKSGEFKDVAHPLNNETRRQIEETVLSEYRSVATDPTPRRPDRPDDEDATSDRVWSAPVKAVPPTERAGLETGTETGKEAGIEDRPLEDRSLEEVQEEHLRDSFWTVS